MNATITEGRCSGLPWLTVTGSREEAFSELGRHAAAEIRAVLAELPERGPLERSVATPGGKAALGEFSTGRVASVEAVARAGLAAASSTCSRRRAASPTSPGSCAGRDEAPVTLLLRDLVPA